MATSAVYEFLQKEERENTGELAARQLALIQTLSDEQVWEIRQAFAHFDKDDSGTIGTKELGSLFRALGQNVSDEELLQIIIRVDVDHDGLLDFPEFLHLMACLLAKTKTEDANGECFRVFDGERSGKISASSMKQQLKAVYALLGVPEPEVAKLFEYLGLGRMPARISAGDEARPSSTSLYDNIEPAAVTFSAISSSSNTNSNNDDDNTRFVTSDDFAKWLQPPPSTASRNNDMNL